MLIFLRLVQLTFVFFAGVHDVNSKTNFWYKQPENQTAFVGEEVRILCKTENEKVLSQVFFSCKK